MLKLNYFIHLLLISKYRLLIHIVILALIYLSIYGDNIIYCMNENTDAIPSPKRPRSPEVSGLAKEIEDYIVPLTSVQDELAQVKAELKETRDALRVQEDLVSERDGQIYNLKAKIRQVKEYRNMHRFDADCNKYYLDKYRERFGPLLDIPGYRGPEIPYSDSGSEFGSIPSEYYDSDS